MFGVLFVEIVPLVFFNRLYIYASFGFLMMVCVNSLSVLKSTDLKWLLGSPLSASPQSAPADAACACVLLCLIFACL